MRENHYVLFRRSDGYWYYYIYRYGKRVYRSTGEKKKTFAIDVVNDRVFRGDLLNEKKDVRPKTFAEFSEPFWIYDTCPIIQDRLKRGGHYTKAFCHTNRKQLEKYLLPAFGKKVLPEITQAREVFDNGSNIIDYGCYVVIGSFESTIDICNHRSKVRIQYSAQLSYQQSSCLILRCSLRLP